MTLPNSTNIYTIITDGSADNRGDRSGGWAAIVRSASSLVELVGYDKETSSNRMEMTAVIEGLRSIPEPSEVTVITDSAYVLNAMRERWYERWIREGKPRPNMDLWYQLIGLAHYHNITWIKIKGHAGDYWNERADRLADHARRGRVTSTNRSAFLDARCPDIATSGRQCKLHANHTGGHHWTDGAANGVMAYGSS